MPLRDHFHPPLKDRRSWDEVHGGWPMEIVRQLFAILPDGYQASPKIHLGSPIEVDIGEFVNYPNETNPDTGGGVATLVAPSPTYTLEAELTEQDQYEIRIFDGYRQLVAAIELISPSNKDRVRSREQFANKVVELIQQDISVSVVDLVSDNPVNLCDEVLGRINPKHRPLKSPPPYLHAATMKLDKQIRKPDLVSTWFYPMAIGQPLPEIPLWLRWDLHVMLPLEPGYEETCRLLRIQ